MILDDYISPPTGFSNQNVLREVILTWDGKSESIEFMAGVVRDQLAHARREEFRNILEYYRYEEIYRIEKNKFYCDLDIN
jgi:hypothetical protein